MLDGIKNFRLMVSHPFICPVNHSLCSKTETCFLFVCKSAYLLSKQYLEFSHIYSSVSSPTRMSSSANGRVFTQSMNVCHSGSL